MNREVAWHAVHLCQELGKELPGEREARRIRIGLWAQESPGCLGCGSRIKVFGHPVHHIRRKGQRLGDLPHRRTGAIGDHVADHAHVILAIAFIDVLDDLLPPVCSKVDVDIGHGARTLAQKPLKEQVVAQRIDRGDVQEVGHQRVGCRSPSLTANALLAGETNNVPYDEKVAGQSGPLDDGQFMAQLGLGLGRDGVELALQPLPAQMAEVGLQGISLGHREGRQPLHRKIEADVAPLSDAQCVAQGLGQVAEQCGHLTGRFQIALRVGMQEPPRQRLRKGGMLANAGQDVVQPPARPPGIMHVVGGHDAGAQSSGQADQLRIEPGVGRQIVPLQLEPETASAKNLRELACHLVGFFLILGQQGMPAAGKTDEPRSVSGQGIQCQLGLCFLARQLPGAEEAAQVGIATLCLGQQCQVIALGQGHFGTDDRLEASGSRRLPEAHCAIQPIVIGEGQCWITQFHRPPDQCLR